MPFQIFFHERLAFQLRRQEDMKCWCDCFRLWETSRIWVIGTDEGLVGRSGQTQPVPSSETVLFPAALLLSHGLCLLTYIVFNAVLIAQTHVGFIYFYHSGDRLVGCIWACCKVGGEQSTTPQGSVMKSPSSFMKTCMVFPGGNRA